MASVNKVILVGNLGKDPEIRYTSSGRAVVRFTLATHKVINKNGEKQRITDWHRIVVWDRLAEICGQYLTKGKQVYIEGELRTRSFVGRDGETRWITEVVARNMQMLGSRNGNDSGEAIVENTGDESVPPLGDDIPEDGFEEEDDVPF